MATHDYYPDWERHLKYLADQYKEAAGDAWTRRFFEGRLIEATVGLPDHPKGFEGVPCACDECCDN